MAENLAPVLPHNPEAEKSVLGAILLDNETLNTAISAGIHPRDFFLPSHTVIYRAMLALREQKRPIDTVTIYDFLEKEKLIERAGGPGYLAALTDGVPSVSNVQSYAQIVVDKSYRRRVIFLSERMQKQAFLEQDVADIEKELATLRTGNGRNNGNGHHLSDSLVDFMGMDFPEPEHLVNGIFPQFGSVIVIAKPHRLKSYFTTALALQATRVGKICGYLDVEKPVRTMLVQVEDFPGEVKKRIGRFMMAKAYRDVEVANVRVVTRKKGFTVNQAWYDQLEREAQDFKPNLIILDVLRRVFHTGDVNSPKDTALFLEGMDWLRDSVGCTVCLVHHENKKDAEMMDAAAGSYNFPGWANVMIQCGRKTTEGEITHVEVEVDNKVGVAPEPMRMTLNFAADEPLSLSPLDDATGASEAQIRLGDEWDVRSLCEVTGIHKNSAYRRIKHWCEKGIAEKITKGKRGRVGGLARYRFLNTGDDASR